MPLVVTGRRCHDWHDGGQSDVGRGGDVTTDYTVAVSGTGVTLSADSLTLTFAAGATTATLTLTPVDDAAVEGPRVGDDDDRSRQRLHGGFAVVGRGHDRRQRLCQPTVSAAVDRRRPARRHAERPIAFTVTRSGNTAGTTAVNLTWSGTATSTTDYTVAVSGTGVTMSANSLTLTFAAGAHDGDGDDHSGRRRRCRCAASR